MHCGFVATLRNSTVGIVNLAAIVPLIVLNAIISCYT